MAVRGVHGVLLLGGLAAGDVTTGRVVHVTASGRHARVVGSLAAAVHDASGAWFGGRALVFGGGAAQEVADVQSWSAGGGRRVGALPEGRSDSAAAVAGPTAYVAGGYDGRRVLRTVVGTRDGRSFRVVGRLRVGVRYPAVAALDGQLWVMGGDLATTTGTAGGPQTDVIQRFDPGTGRTTVVGHLPHELGHASAFVLGGRLFVAGGRRGPVASARVWSVDPASGRASPAGRLPYGVSDAPVVVTGAGTALLVGGETVGPSAPRPDVVRLRLAVLADDR